MICTTTLLLTGCEILPDDITNGYPVPINLTVYSESFVQPLTATLIPDNGFAFRSAPGNLRRISWTTPDGQVQVRDVDLPFASGFHLLLRDGQVERAPNR